MRFKEFGGFKYDFDRLNIRLRFGMEETGTREWRSECCEKTNEGKSAGEVKEGDCDGG